MTKYLILLTYFLLMVGIGFYSAKKIANSGDFLVAGNNGGIWQITGSLLATILGSTAIMGSCDLAFMQGWAAAWLLLSASLGLFLLFLVAPLVKRYGKYTLPQLIADLYGKEAKIIASMIIPIAWVGVIAAQIIGGAKVLNSFFGMSYGTSVWVIGLIFTFYTAIGGQISVIKTDLIQSFIIISGISLVILYLIFWTPVQNKSAVTLMFPFNSGFSPSDLVILILTYSSTFLVGPDIYTRIFCAKSEVVATKSVLFTALVLIPFAFMITFLGVYAARNFPNFDFSHGSSLITVLNSILPEWGIGLLVAAILSAVMSSASTTLMTSSVILANIFQKDLETQLSILHTKLIMIAVGLFSIILSLFVTSIVQSLLIALTFFSGAFIIPVLAGLKGFRNNKMQSNIAIVIGGLVALSGKIMVITGESLRGNVIIFCAFLANALILFPGGKWLKSED